MAVLLSSFNGEKYIRAQLDSIIAQKGDFNLSIIVRDDGSTDSTTDILDQYQKDGKLTWYSGDNLGPALSFMDLLYNCGDFDYYAFSDQDDVWDDDKIQSALDMLVSIKNPALYYCNAVVVDADLHNLGTVLYKRNPISNFETSLCAANGIGCSMVMNNALVEVIRSGRMPRIINMHDAYVMKVCSAIGGSIIYDSECHFKYRQHGDNVLGVKTDFKDKIKDRLSSVIHRSKIPIDAQAREILDIYGDFIPEENKNILNIIISYKDNIRNRVRLAFSKNTHFCSLNSTIVIRLSIITGNR